MSDTTTTKASQVRASVGHPIVDADGHFVEISPVLNDEVVSYVEEIGGAALRGRYLGAGTGRGIFHTTSALQDRGSAAVRDEWRAMPSWWGWQTRNTLDRATAHLP